MRLPDGLHAELKAAASASGRSLHAEILRRLEGWVDGDELEGAEPRERPAGPSAAAGLQRDPAPVAPVFAPAVELASVPPAQAPPVVVPGPESAERAVDVSGLMLRLRGPGPVEKAKADLAKVLAGPKVLRKPKARLEGACVHGELYCERCPGHH